MFRTCCVLGCGVTSTQDIIFFDFPTSRLLRQRWLKAIAPTCKITLESGLCSKHFAKTDYEYIRGKVRLKRKVVPTLFIKDTSVETRTEDLIENSISDKTEKSNNNIDNKSVITNDKIKTVHKNNKKTKKNIDKICEKLIINKNNKLDASVNNGIADVLGHTPNGPSICADSKIANETLVHGVVESTNETHSDKHTEIDSSDNNVNSVSDSVDKFTVNTSDECSKNVINSKTDINSDENVINNKIANKSAPASESAGKPAGVRTRRGRPVGPGAPVVHVSTDLADSGTDSASEVSLRSTNDYGRKLGTAHVEPDKQDIEELLTNYQIVKSKPRRLASPPPPVHPAPHPADDVQEVPVHSAKLKEKDPVYIEIAVGQEGAARSDCLLVMESVQVELDPAALMLPDRDDDCANSKEDPISLLTSSDEDDVIIQEPKIDTVELSSETDEDDVPLVRLARPGSPDNLARIFWGVYRNYCLQCKYSAADELDYRRHVRAHQTVLHVCHTCGYTTASRPQLERHSRKHAADKKFKCHLCDFKAKHHMSLIYHMKSHSKTKVLDLDENEGRKKRRYSCLECTYSTDRWSDLNRHRSRRHPPSDTDDDCQPK